MVVNISFIKIIYEGRSGRRGRCYLRKQGSATVAHKSNRQSNLGTEKSVSTCNERRCSQCPAPQRSSTRIPTVPLTPSSKRREHRESCKLRFEKHFVFYITLYYCRQKTRHTPALIQQKFLGELLVYRSISYYYFLSFSLYQSTVRSRPSYKLNRGL